MVEYYSLYNLGNQSFEQYAFHKNKTCCLIIENLWVSKFDKFLLVKELINKKQDT